MVYLDPSPPKKKKLIFFNSILYDHDYCAHVYVGMRKRNPIIIVIV